MADRQQRWNVGRIGRLLALVLSVVIGYFVLAVGGEWSNALLPPYRVRPFQIGFLRAATVAYALMVPTVVVAGAISGGVVIRARRVGARRRWAMRVLTASVATLLGAGLAEVGASAWIKADRRVRIPVLPTEFPDLPRQGGIDVLVIGESSAQGTPYSQWFSVGDIIAWKLREALHDERVLADVEARWGHTLGNQVDQLRQLLVRPDLAIIYAGHNEFQSIYNWSHSAYHYADETPPRRETFTSLSRRVSPLCRAMQITLEKLRLSLPPPRIITRRLVDVPVYTPSEYGEMLERFDERLEFLVTYLERLEAQTVMIIPPANDAGFEPNRSFLPPHTSRSEREAFARDFEAARLVEARSPEQALTAYRSLLARQPRFAETHFRIARLLEKRHDWEGAFQHYTKARDLDGFPMRCPSDYQNVYRAVASRHPSVILVDGIAALRKRSPRGLLDDAFFNDGFHPSLIGHTALAEEILIELHRRRALGWPPDSPAPSVSPADCATHFGMNASRWHNVCEYAAWFYTVTAYIRYDPTERLAKMGVYKEAARKVLAGEPFATIDVPGVGPSMPRPANLESRSSATTR